MIRPKRFVTETCVRCQRAGWRHENRYQLLTEEEYNGKITPIPGLPSGFELMEALCGSSIFSAVDEAIDYCREYKVKGAGFMFNDKPVFVTAKSNAEAITKDWWKRVYNETYEESMARR